MTWSTPTTDDVLDERQKATDEVVFIGQERIKTQLEPFITTEKFPHVLLTGDPGLGKSQGLYNEVGRTLRQSSIQIPWKPR